MLKTLSSAFVLIVAAANGVSAAPLTAGPDATAPRDASIVLAANGCGPGFFRTITGECVPNRRVLVGPGIAVNAGPPCPRGFRRDPDPRRRLCYPIY